MKTKSVYTISMFLIFFFSTTILFGSMMGQENKEKRDVGNFEEIGLGVAADLYLKQGSTTEVIIEAKEEILKKLKTEVKNGKLYIGFDSKKSFNYPRFKIYITTPDINGLSVSGSGDIIAETAVSTDEISLKISGSGDINIDNLQAKKVLAGISGSGNIYLGGSNLDYLEIGISGSGNLKAEKLPTEDFQGRISGSGSCRINVKSTLKASISGSGRIHYSGNPLIDASISGSGKVISTEL